MKNKLLLIALLASTAFSFAQTGKTAWKSTSKKATATVVGNKTSISNPRLYELDVTVLKASLVNSPNRFTARSSNVIVAFPNTEGQMERFRIMESSNMEPELAARYPEIKSYVGQGIDTPSSTIYFSLSPLGLQTMVIKADQSAEFIEPYTTDKTAYAVYKKSDKTASLDRFECKVIDVVAPKINGNVLRPNADDALLRTFRLAMSATGEYTAYFGGTKALALAAINNTMTRVNGVFEKDFGARMNLIATTDSVIYTNASTDPYSAAATGVNGAWNTELQNTLTSVIGNAGYDIGHLFGASGGGGNAGCIGCICVNDTASTTDTNKGSGFTSPADGIPSGDNFDIDYVAHEMGHQFGANHTFTQGTDTATTTNSNSDEATGVQMEPGSGSTIMGYAGITIRDVQPHSDPYFHAISIQQVTNNIKAKTCSVNTATGNAIPTANAGLDYTIPKSTPFMLTGAGTDANGDVLTYDWEQMDAQANNASPSATKTTGVAFRSYNPSTNTVRYFPTMATVLTGGTTTAGSELTVEALPSVARTMNFRLTVRDNRAGGPANNSDDMIVTVNATAGPFAVTAPNTAVSYVGGSSQTITWNVAGTTANGVNCANVDILISTNGGTSWSTLLAATPNDGTQAVTLPNTPGSTNRIMVKGNNHIFFDVSNTNFTITSGTTDTTAPTAPTLSASGTTQTATNLSWSGATDNVAVTGYDVYRDTTLLGSTTTATTFAVSGLTAATTYSFTVKAKDAAGNVSVASNTVSVTTLAATGGATDLLFSEYIEGSSNNKALEIANNTGVAVNLGIYSVKKQTNGAGAWSTGIVLSGTLNNGAKFVLVNSAIALACFNTASANISTAGNELTFNGNDAVGLFKNGVLIDIIGTFNGGAANFAIDTTLRRKATVTAPNVTFNLAGEWDSFAIDTCGGLGNKTAETATAFTLESIQLYPNPVVGNILNIDANVDLDYSIINMLGQQIAKGKVTDGTISVANLAADVYLLELTLNDQKVVKRFMKK